MANETTKQLIATITPEDATDKTVEWATSDSSVATVDNNGLVTCVDVGTCVITATASNDLSASCNVRVVSAMPDSIEIVGSNEMTTGTTTQLTAIITPNEDYIDKTVTWSSDKPTVASVNSSGRVTAGTKEDTATITARTVNRLTSSHTINVTIEPEPEEVEVTTDRSVIYVGETTQFIATVKPDNVKDKTVEWTSDNTEVATIDDNGLVTGIKYGSSLITATASNGLEGWGSVYVYSHVSSITITPPSPFTMNVGDRQKFSAVVNPVGEVDSSSVDWSSSNPDILNIYSPTEIATALKVGIAIITATAYDGTTATVEVTVVDTTPTSIELNKNSITLWGDDAEQLVATVLPEDASDKTVTWSSSNEGVATVVDGLVTGVADGDVVITATSSNGLTATCNVTVKEIKAFDYIDEIGETSIAAAPNVDKDGIMHFTSTMTDADTTTLDKLLEIKDTSYEISFKVSNMSNEAANIKVMGNKIISGDNPSYSCIYITPRYSSNSNKPYVYIRNELNNSTAVNYSKLIPSDIHEFDVLYKYIHDEGAYGTIYVNINNLGEDKIVVSSADNKPNLNCLLFGRFTTAGNSDSANSFDLHYLHIKLTDPISITLDKTEEILSLDRTSQLTATIVPSIVKDDTVTWTSSDSNVATVDSNGLVTTIGEGVATITATTVNELSATYTITAQDVSGFDYIDEISGTSILRAPTLNEDNNLYFVSSAATPMPISNLTVLDDYVELDCQDTWEIDLEYNIDNEPSVATNAITFISGETSLASPLTIQLFRAKTSTVSKLEFYLIDGAGNSIAPPYKLIDDISYSYTGAHHLNIKSYGNGKITVKFDDIDEATIYYVYKDNYILNFKNIGTCYYNNTTMRHEVFDYTITSLHIKNFTPPAPTSINLFNYQELDLNPSSPAWYLVAMAEPYNANAKVDWTSSDENVATVDGQGRVRYVADGEAVITATSVNGLTTESKVTCFSNPQFNFSDAISSRYPTSMPTVDRKGRMHITPFMKLDDFVKLNGRVSVGARTSEIMVRYEILAESDIYNNLGTLADAKILYPFGSYSSGTLAHSANYDYSMSLSRGALVTNRRDTISHSFYPYTTGTVLDGGYHQAIIRTTKNTDTLVNVSVKWDTDSFKSGTSGLAANLYYINGNMIGATQRSESTERKVDQSISPFAIIHSINIRTSNSTLPTSISLNHTTYELPLNRTLELIPSILPTSTTYKDVVWTSTDESIATVDENGMVTPLAKGNAIIKCSMLVDPTKSATCSIEVVDPVVEPESVSLNITSDDIQVDSTLQLTATVLPENTTDKSIAWSSSDDTVATVVDGLVTAIDMGACTITATTSNGLTATCDITVYNVLPTAIDISGDSELRVDFTSQLIATITPSNSSATDIVWSSSAPDIVTVDENGLLTGISQGDAVITATTINNISATHDVEVWVPSEFEYFDGKNGTYCVSTPTFEARTGSILITKTMTLDQCTILDKDAILSAEDEWSLECNFSTKSNAAIILGSNNQPVKSFLWVYLNQDGMTKIIFANNVSGPSASTTFAIFNPPIEQAKTHNLKVESLGDKRILVSLNNSEWVPIDFSTAPEVVLNYGVVGEWIRDVSLPNGSAFDEVRIYDISITQPTIEPESVSLNITSDDIQVDTTLQLIATVLPENTTDKSIAWSSSDDTVAVVADGLVTAIDMGTCTITATTFNGLTATCDINVYTPHFDYIDEIGGTSIASMPNVDKDGIMHFTNEMIYADAAVFNKPLLLNSNTSFEIEYKLSNIGNLALRHYILGYSAATDDPNTSRAELEVTLRAIGVQNHPIAAIRTIDNGVFAPTATHPATLDSGIKTHIVKIRYDKDAGTYGTIYFSINNLPEQASPRVSTNKIDIQFECIGRFDSTGQPQVPSVYNLEYLYIRKAKPSSISITGDSEVEMGQSIQLSATVLPSDANDLSVSWSSSDEDIATVVDGLVTGISEGEVTITATTSNNISATHDVEVYYPIPFNYVDELAETEIAASPNVDKYGIMHIHPDLTYAEATTLDSPLDLGSSSYRLEFKLSNISSEGGTAIVMGNKEDAEDVTTRSFLYFNARYSLNSNKPYVYIKNKQGINCAMAYSQEMPADTHEFIATIKYISTNGDYGALYLDINGMGEDEFIVEDETKIPTAFFTLFGRFNADASPNMPNTYDIEFFNVAPITIVDPTSIEFDVTDMKLLLD